MELATAKPFLKRTLSESCHMEELQVSNTPILGQVIPTHFQLFLYDA